MADAASEKPRLLLAQDTEGHWFVRRVFSSIEDWESDHMIYRCNEHLGGPFDLAGAATFAKDYVWGDAYWRGRK